jgi:hypothetical protein
MKKHIDTLDGKGTVVATTGKTKVDYVLRIYQEQIPDGLGGGIPGLKSIQGRIQPALRVTTERLTLELDDKRTLDFFVKDAPGKHSGNGWNQRSPKLKGTDRSPVPLSKRSLLDPISRSRRCL